MTKPKFPLQINGVTLFTDYENFIRLYNLTDKIWDILSKIDDFYDVNDTDKKTYILSLIKKYPEIPDFKARLIDFYEVNNEQQKVKKWTKKILEIHPNYFLAKINLVRDYLKANQIEEAATVLGGGRELELKDFIPHVNEYMKEDFFDFYDVAMHVHIERGDIDLAFMKFGDMIRVDKNHKDTKKFRDNLDIKITYLGSPINPN